MRRNIPEYSKECRRSVIAIMGRGPAAIFCKTHLSPGRLEVIYASAGDGY